MTPEALRQVLRAVPIAMLVTDRNARLVGANDAAEALLAEGEAAGLRPCGMLAMNAARLEKGFRHMGHDITPEDHVIEAGLGFAVATALIKTEPVTLAILGAALLAEPLTPARLGAIAVATAGVLAMSGGGWRRAGAGPAALAVLAGGLFGLSAIGFRGGILSLPHGGELIRATTILVLSLALQTALVGVWLALRDRPALRGMVAAWRESLGAGFLGALASQFWFLAFALALAANVRTLALVEVVFAAAVSRHRREALGPRQLAGMALIVAGVGWLMWTTR